MAKEAHAFRYYQVRHIDNSLFVVGPHEVLLRSAKFLNGRGTGTSTKRTSFEKKDEEQ